MNGAVSRAWGGRPAGAAQMARYRRPQLRPVERWLKKILTVYSLLPYVKMYISQSTCKSPALRYFVVVAL